jgi:hypothetical protein
MKIRLRNADRWHAVMRCRHSRQGHTGASLEGGAHSHILEWLIAPARSAKVAAWIALGRGLSRRGDCLSSRRVVGDAVTETEP